MDSTTQTYILLMSEIEIKSEYEKKNYLLPR